MGGFECEKVACSTVDGVAQVTNAPCQCGTEACLTNTLFCKSDRPQSTECSNAGTR